MRSPSMSPEPLLRTRRDLSEMVVVGREHGVLFDLDLARQLRFGAHLLLVLPTGHFLEFGDLLHVQKCVPTKHAEDRERGPLDRVQVTERVAEYCGAQLDRKSTRLNSSHLGIS